MSAAPPPGNSPPGHPHLQRRFGLLQATALNMSNMVGIGPFITIPALMSALGGPQAMLGWVVALVITLADAAVWSELGAALPGSGGSFVYLREGFGRQTWGRLMGFLFIWQFIVSGPLEIASGLIGFAQYLNYVWPGVATAGGLSLKGGLVVIGVGVLCVAALYRHVASVGRITVLLWAGTLLTAGGVILTGAFHFDAAKAFDFPAGAFQFSWGFVMGLGAASRIGVYDYLGYYDVCFIGDEVKNPGRVIPRSILWSLLGVAALYLGINLAITGIVSWREFVPATDPPAPVVSWMMERVYGRGVANVFTLLILWTAFGSVFALLLGYSRIPYAAARDGYFFKPFAAVHPEKNIPHVSLLVIGVAAVAFSFLPLMVVIDALLVTRILVQFIGQIGAVILLRRHSPNLARPYRIWLYPLPPLIALAGWIFLFSSVDGRMRLYGVGFLAAGAAAFLLWSRHRRQWPWGQRSSPMEG